MATSESPDQSPAETEPEGTATDWHAEATRLRQELAQAKDTMRQVQGYAQLGYALRNAKGSEKIIEKLSKGEELTDAQKAAVEKSGAEQGLTTDQIASLLEENSKKVAQEVEQRIWAQRKAERNVEKMHLKMAKELPGYENIYDSPEFARRWDRLYNEVQEGHLEIPHDEEPFDFLAKRTYDWFKFENPEIGKMKPAKRTDAERRSAMMRAGAKSEAVPEEGNRELEEALREAVPPGGKSKVGRSLQELRRS